MTMGHAFGTRDWIGLELDNVLSAGGQLRGSSCFTRTIAKALVESPYTRVRRSAVIKSDLVVTIISKAKRQEACALCLPFRLGNRKEQQPIIPKEAQPQPFHINSTTSSRIYDQQGTQQLTADFYTCSSHTVRADPNSSSIIKDRTHTSLPLYINTSEQRSSGIPNGYSRSKSVHLHTNYLT